MSKVCLNCSTVNSDASKRCSLCKSESFQSFEDAQKDFIKPKSGINWQAVLIVILVLLALLKGALG